MLLLLLLLQRLLLLLFANLLLLLVLEQLLPPPVVASEFLHQASLLCFRYCCVPIRCFRAFRFRYCFRYSIFRRRIGRLCGSRMRLSAGLAEKFGPMLALI